MTRRRTRALVAGLATAGLVLAPLTAGAAQAASHSRHTVANTKPRWLKRAKRLESAGSNRDVTARVYLAPHGGLDALKSAVAAVSTPGSSSYHHFLTPAQYRAAYAPTSADVKSVSSWLRSSGLKVTSVEPSHRWVSVRGDTTQAEKAFHVDLGVFKHDGQTVVAPDSAASAPADVAAHVLTITGLDTTKSVKKPAASTPAPPPASYVNGRPCSHSWGQLSAKYQADYKTPLPKLNGKTLSYSVCGYTGPQLRAAYEGGTTLDGTGTTVAVVDAYAAPTLAADADHYAQEHGDGAYGAKQLTQVTPKKYTHTAADDCDASGWYGEQTLDVEAVHAVAPGASIRYYGAKSCYDDDLLAALNQVVDQNQASIVTNSWGEPDSAESSEFLAAYTQTFLQGALQGITFAFSSGDNGDELQNTGLKQSDSPASNPYVTAVGGTSTAIGADGKLAWQTGWGTQKYTLSTDGASWKSAGYLYGAGGGYSTLFNRPSYQDGVVPSSAPAGRAVPDVAMDADPTTGMLIGETQTFPDGSVHYGEYRIGGTSLASPLYAGIQALAQQSSGKRVGFANPALYAKAGSNAFLDVLDSHQGLGDVRADYVNGNDPSGGLTYSVRTFDQDSSLDVTPGWDDVTGLGVPSPTFLTSLN